MLHWNTNAVEIAYFRALTMTCIDAAQHWHAKCFVDQVYFHLTGATHEKNRFPPDVGLGFRNCWHSNGPNSARSARVKLVI
jgi:hypothetical protein